MYLSFSKEVVDILEEKNVRYSLGGGDMLGAIKFGKFLPW